MQFLHLYYEDYPAGDNPEKHRLSYPYAVIIRDKDERAEFAEMLERDGFKRVTFEHGISVMYVNFTLKRFGYAVKAVSSGTIDNDLHEKSEFMENIYSRYKSDESYQQDLENNYALSAARSIVSSIGTLMKNRTCIDKRFFDYEFRRIEMDMAEVRRFMEEFRSSYY